MEKIELQISPFLAFFMIHSIQVGVGVLGFQRIIIKSVGNDAWMAVIFASVVVSGVIWMLYKLLNRHQKDIIAINQEFFGKWIGNSISFIWIFNWIILAVTILRSFIEIVQVWVFPTINIYIFAFFFILLTYSAVIGGFRIVAGICLLGIVIPFYLFLTFFFPFEFTYMRNLLPVWNHTFKEMGMGMKDMTLSYLGFSTLLMYYPFIRNAKKSLKWALLGNFATTAIYLFLIIVTIGFYSEGQIAQHIWATLSMWKIVELPFVERFEYIGITSWCLIILPNLCLSVWAASQALQKITKFKPKFIVIVILMIVYSMTVIVEGRAAINALNNYMAILGVALLIGYIPLLNIISLYFSKKRRKYNENQA